MATPSYHTPKRQPKLSRTRMTVTLWWLLDWRGQMVYDRGSIGLAGSGDWGP